MTAIQKIIEAYPTLWEALKLIVMATVAIIAVSLILRLEKKISNRLMAKRNDINLRFVENIVRFVVIFLAGFLVFTRADRASPRSRASRPSRSSPT